ncbi:MAG TPA: hypothetical protein VI258_00150 [Rhodanobacteraceae bacterium]
MPLTRTTRGGVTGVACALAFSAAAVDRIHEAPAERYAGTWQTRIVYLDTPFSKAHTESTTLRNDCWSSGDFSACRQDVNGKPSALLVYLRDAGSGGYTVYPIARGSGAVQPAALLVDGEAWIFPWQTGAGEKATYFRIVNRFPSSDTIEFRQEYSRDGTHWSTVATGTEHRVR